GGRAGDLRASAVAADAEYRRMVQSGLEAVALAQPRSQRLDHLVGELLPPPTLEADEVVMPVVADIFVLDLPGAEVGLRDEPLLLQPGQRAVDRRDIDVGVYGAHALVDHLGGLVAAALNRLEHHQALRREPLAARAQGRGHRVATSR